MLRLCNIERIYTASSAPVAALAGVCLDIAPGEWCAIVGPSGSGKSTLLNLIGLLDRPTAGQLFLDGREVSAVTPSQAAAIRNRTHGFVFQSFHLLARLTAWENVALPLLYRGVAKPQRREPALAMLAKVGLADRADHRPAELSGGQRQRVAIARALVGGPSLILADEPTGSLDTVSAGEVMSLFAQLNAELGVTIVMVTHDREVAGQCGRRVEMRDGRVVADSGRRAA